MLIVLIEIFILLSSALFVYKNIDNNMEESLYALVQISGSSCVFFLLIHAYINHHQIDGIFEKIHKIYAGM